MFKKVLSAAMAMTMALSMAATAMAEMRSTVYAVEANSYAYSKELGAVNLNEKNPLFSYGDTVYYPLLSSEGVSSEENVTEAQNQLTVANEALTASKNALAEAETSLKEKEAALIKANEKKDFADKVLEAANNWKTSSDSLADDEAAMQLKYNEALTAYDAEAVPALSAEEAVSGAEGFVDTETAEAESKTGERDAAKSLKEEKAADVKAKEDIVKEKQAALNEALKASRKYVDSTEAVKGIKVKSSWELNGSAVENVSLTKKKAAAPFELTNKYIYFLSVELKDSGATNETDIIGNISMKKTGEFDYEDMNLDIALTVGYPEAEDNIITTKPMVFSEGSGFTGDAEEELGFSFDEDASFTVDTLGQGKILLAADNEFDANIAMIYNAANLDFFNGNGASFNKLGTLKIPAEEGSFIYKADKDGKLSKADAKYDADEEAFIIRTRTLGRYVISDIDLRLNEVKPSKPNGSGSYNPQTGANI